MNLQSLILINKNSHEHQAENIKTVLKNLGSLSVKRNANSFPSKVRFKTDSNGKERVGDGLITEKIVSMMYLI